VQIVDFHVHQHRANVMIFVVVVQKEKTDREVDGQADRRDDMAR